MVHFYSWNVLYREYEQKYNPKSHILDIYTDETARIQSQTQLVISLLDNSSVFCLQECSWGLIKELRKRLPSYYTVFYRKTDSQDYVVTVSPSFFKNKYIVYGSWCKGMVVIENNKYCIINCHLTPQRYSQYNVMKELQNITTDKKRIICGDFNERYNRVFNFHKNTFLVSKFNRTYKKKQLDYIMIEYPVKIISKKICKNNTSDHALISIQVQLE